MLLLAVSVRAVERTLLLDAPPVVKAGSDVTVAISASTDAGQGERIGFFHVESSRDDGQTWTALCFLENIGASKTQTITLPSGKPRSIIRVRARVAFRDGLAGDVDYTGAAIRWTETWEMWREPPAKSVTITVAER